MKILAIITKPKLPDFEVFSLHLTVLTILLVISYLLQKYEPIHLGWEKTFKKEYR